MATFENAKALGVEVKQEWLATLDGRTRYSHRRLDGEKVEVGGTFSEDLYAVDLADGKTITNFVTSRVVSNATPGKRFKAKVSDALDGSASDPNTLMNNGCALGVKKNLS